MEYRYRHTDGHYVWLETIGNPLFDEAGELIGAIFGTREVTERRQTLERLVLLNHLFLEMGADPLEGIRKLLEGGRGAAGRQADEVPEESRGRPAHLLPGGGGRGPCRSARNRAVTRTSTKGCSNSIARWCWEPERRRAAPSRTPTWPAEGPFPAWVRPSGSEGVTIGYLLVFDAAARAFSPSELEILGMLARAVAIAEERSAREEDLRDFIDVASHELRQPITIMKGYAETMEAMGERASDEMWKEGLRAINHGADRLETLVADLLETSRIERERFLMVKRETPPEDLVASALEEMAKRRLDNPFSVRVTGEPVRGVGRPGPPGAATGHLLDNAVKYSPPASGIEIEVEMEKAMFTISVADRGLGIPPEDVERIFDRFYQVEDVMHHSIPGIGLGLYIGRKIVEAHGGRIWYEPREGGGSVFRFSMPVALRDREWGGPDEG